MKKDIFTVWLKEFCSLVFTQAVQAFLLAVIMTVIVATASGNLDINKDAMISHAPSYQINLKWSHFRLHRFFRQF